MQYVISWRLLFDRAPTRLRTFDACR